MSKKVHERFLEISTTVSVRLAAAISDIGPVKLSKRSDRPLDEVLCRMVAGQQLSTKAASTIWARVIDSTSGRDLMAHIAATETSQLRSCGLSNAKTKAMKAIADASAQGRLDVSPLKACGHAERSKQLTSIWGVGQWTADMVSIFYFGDKDVWPDGDVTVWKTLERLTDKRRRTLLTAARFAPHRSYLALYMYRIADAQP